MMKSQRLRNFQRNLIGFSQGATRILRRIFSEGFTHTAGSLTYTTILAIVPVTIVSVMVLSVSPIFQKMIVEVQAFLIKNFVPEVGEVIRDNLGVFAAQAERLPLPGIAFLFVLAVLMLLIIEKAFNAIWRVPARRKGLSAWLRYILIIALSPIFIGVSIWATTHLISAPFLGNQGGLGISSLLVSILPFMLTVVGFTVLYVIVPNCRVPWRFAFLGALIAAVALEIAKKIFVFYMTQFPTYKILYGTLAAIPIFLLWIFISWMIILIGALVSNEMTWHHFRKKQAFQGNSAFSSTLNWLFILWEAKKKGKSVAYARLYASAAQNHLISPDVQLCALIEAKLVKLLRNSQVILACDLDEYTIKQLYRDMPWKVSMETLSGFDAIMTDNLAKMREDIEMTLDVPLARLFTDR